ncbi:putative F-box domain, galactose oxidase/kelch, beta-propeller, F-box associated interaction [Rosa chinensis]|uniref:Putative F-box domain, galactose oxidase/kelch, beta-propeller, F-box associated interaction n=1 Tax=Rosa chinensis TaxID=74649 RepID=A0A2P6R7Y1_ROSCH|nr:F-box/kelch-repeat protein At3g23880 [Rosa chinensis]PRQ42544.1 putative F-box domain, galactose oxidase/kelch, beta-propeller, F-box associated interaction [Rosa chinensis]
MRNKRREDVASSITEDLHMEILARLPVKSLIRFQCVCKRWRGLIRSSSFVTAHIRQHSHTHLITDDRSSFDQVELCYSLFHCERFEQSLELKPPFHPQLDYNSRLDYFKIYGSKNGLLCLAGNVMDSNSPIYIWNPSVRKFRTLPQPRFDHYCVDCFPKHVDIPLLFGFHPELNDYKVIRMMLPGSIKMEVYTLSTNSWKIIQVIPPWLNTMKFSTRSEFWNGMAYWLATKDSMVRVVLFDTNNEEFEELAVPITILSDDWDAYIEVYKESICLLHVKVELDNDVGCDSIDFWVLQEQDFKKLHTVYFPQVYHVIWGFSVDNELLLEDYSSDGELAFYNLESKQVQKIRISSYLSVHTYIESLVLFDM